MFLKRGEAGNSEIFRGFWSYFLAFKKAAEELSRESLFPRSSGIWQREKSPGTPFFSDVIKTYNNGLGWVVENFPFNALDYLLAVEGALALRGAVSRTLTTNSRRFAAFPFVFDSGEDFVDDSNEVKGTASSIWLPLWDRPTCFAELESFICDAQARLPNKEARFSAEFARALRAQGVDAGFAGWQEFRFKMRASRVPWICTGRYLGAVVNERSTLLNDALAPLDESRFLDQFEIWRGRDGKIKGSSPHYLRVSINAAIENAVAQPIAENALRILLAVFCASQQLTASKDLREKIGESGRRVTFCESLPQEAWQKILDDLDSPEFRIARALAGIQGTLNSKEGDYFLVQPFLGSILPLKCPRSRQWYLPTEPRDRSKQTVWSGADLAHDLTRVFARRYLDSLEEDRPAVLSPEPAPLRDILDFVDGKLDDQRIARWIEALSLIAWHWIKPEKQSSPMQPHEDIEDGAQGDFPAIPPAYA
ncbi:MAG: type I-U CRISPR-associated protein Csx17, partial [Verrucomicrobiaceae bacterium]|nr:type I-U CRISPR-associated protein Csx17 [Verrucomicrobiaceae bacterium]